MAANSPAPTTGPQKELTPPSSVLSIGWAEASQCTSSTVTMRDQGAYRQPATAATAPEMTKAASR